MLDFKTWVVNTVVNDTTMQGYIKDGNGNMNIFPIDIDLQPEQFPCIVYQDSGIQVLSRPQGMHVGNFQFDIYSTNNALEVENIYEQLAVLFNFKDSTTQSMPNSSILWWIREQSTRDLHESGRRLWRKVVIVKFWFTKANQT